MCLSKFYYNKRITMRFFLYAIRYTNINLTDKY